jgi:hypothetical protein
MKKVITLALLFGWSLHARTAAASEQVVKSCVTVLKHSVSACTPKDQAQGRCTADNPYAACMSYENSCVEPVKCTLRANARLVEDYTGFTKDVYDWREETIYYNSNHRVCFSFKKDEYNLWKLKNVGKPTVDCEDEESGVQPCTPGQPGCEGTTPPIDPRPCDPFDWSSNC